MLTTELAGSGVVREWLCSTLLQIAQGLTGLLAESRLRKKMLGNLDRKRWTPPSSQKTWQTERNS